MKCFIKFSTKSIFSVLSVFVLAVPVVFASTDSQKSNQSLEEFEEMIAKYRQFSEALQNGDFAIRLKTQQYDTDSQEVKASQNPLEYTAAVTDPYYGYQIFILVDKSIGLKSGKTRDGDKRTPQTMYIYQREADQLRLITTLPVSTGREPSPGVSDTREGFMRVQSAQAQYTSRKFGESMPYSLWFESEYGTAIHQTLQSRCDSAIGQRASAGCIRLCPEDSEKVFNLVTQSPFKRSTPIVLLDKRSGLPIAQNRTQSISRSLDENGMYTSAPKVIRGYPVFVRIIDGNTKQKIQEIESLIQNPTDSFKQYFQPFSPQMLQMLSI